MVMPPEPLTYPPPAIKQEIAPAAVWTAPVVVRMQVRFRWSFSVLLPLVILGRGDG